jgi:hypothetical protein
MTSKGINFIPSSVKIGYWLGSLKVEHTYLDGRTYPVDVIEDRKVS